MPGRALLLLLTLALAGCQTDHYLVAEEGAPLYAAPTGERVLARMRRFHHAPLEQAPPPGPRVALTYRGVSGYAPRSALRLFRYTDPSLDGGEAREAALAREVRTLRLEREGREWSPEVRAAVREGRVLRGMTRRQVELSWGWPEQVLAGSVPGEETWLYTRTRTERVAPPLVGQPLDPWVYRPGLGPQPWGWRHSPQFDYEVQVMDELRVHFDREGRVRALGERTFAAR